ncbi:MAG: hypothetical protein AAF335_03900 [Bacteroidota bacterium]
MHTTYLRLFLVYTFSTVGFQNTQPVKDFQSLPHPTSRTIGYFPLNETNATPSPLPYEQICNQYINQKRDSFRPNSANGYNNLLNSLLDNEKRVPQSFYPFPLLQQEEKKEEDHNSED